MTTTTCPDCGWDPIATGDVCKGCGLVLFGTVVLRGDDERELVSRIDLVVGRRLLRRVIGEDAEYASEPQFRLSRDRRLQCWVLEACAGTVNPTWINDAPASDATPVQLKSGDVVSLAGKSAKLRVEMRQ